MRFRDFPCLTMLFCIALPSAPLCASRPGDSQTYGVNDWRLTIKTIRFSGDTTCQLYSKDHKIAYVANALGLYAGRDYDVVKSWFRLDQGPPMRWRDQMPELARLRVAIDGRDMDRPTDGIIWLPLSLVKDVQSIEVATDRGTKLRSFDLRGFAELHEAALRLGCTPEGRFVQ